MLEHKDLNLNGKLYALHFVANKDDYGNGQFFNAYEVKQNLERNSSSKEVKKDLETLVSQNLLEKKSRDEPSKLPDEYSLNGLENYVETELGWDKVYKETVRKNIGSA